jgi:hypothetical protein
MVEGFFAFGLQYAGYALEGGLLVYLLFRGEFRRLLALSFYIAGLLAIDAAVRPYVLYRYGLDSSQYAYVYWLSDGLLILAAFVLICTMFRRGCANNPSLWPTIRTTLGIVFVLVLGISLLSLSRHYDQLVTRFVVEFEQNLYFTSLILNTLLFVLLHQIGSADEELELLVCGLGIQFAGPAASYALVHLTPGQHFAIILNSFVEPICTLGMLLTWFYAVARAPKGASVTAGQQLEWAPVEGRARNF